MQRADRAAGRPAVGRCRACAKLKPARRNFKVWDGKTIPGPYDVPGKTFNATIGLRLLSGKIELGARYRQVSERTVVVRLAPGNKPILGKQSGYHLYDAFLTYRPHPRWNVSVVGENLGNEKYFLNDGFGGGIGSEAPGRNLRLTMGLSF